MLKTVASSRASWWPHEGDEEMMKGVLISVLDDQSVQHNKKDEKGVLMYDVDGVEMVLTNTDANGKDLIVDAHLLPTSRVSKKTNDAITTYILPEMSLTANIVFRGTKVGVRPSLVVAAFLLQGLNALIVEILQSDEQVQWRPWGCRWSHVGGFQHRLQDLHIMSPCQQPCRHLLCPHDHHPPNGNGFLDITIGKTATPFEYGASHVDPHAPWSPPPLSSPKTFL
ncbi:subtilisin-like protease SBT1.7 [Elaeis guineensis]|uniref:subtilisin-like protease SBT1.7 n=1 Tax=Elaeis guineensis var. tenera TaxID=51953 RepID=UPI003C6D9ED0